MATPNMVVVHTPNGQTKRFRPKKASEILEGLLGSGRGVLESIQQHPDGLSYTGSDEVPAGEYNLVPAAPPPVDPAAVAQSGSLEDGELFVHALLKYGDKQLAAELLVDTGCDMDLNFSEYKAAQLGLPPPKGSAMLEMGQGHAGGVKLRGSVCTTLLLEGEVGNEYLKNPKRTRYLEVWTDNDTAGNSSSEGSINAGSSSGGSSTGADAEELARTAAEQLPSLSLSGSHSSSTEGGILKIHVLSPIKKGKDKHGYDAILGSTGMSRLQLGINMETMRLYRKQTRPGFRKK